MILLILGSPRHLTGSWWRNASPGHGGRAQTGVNRNETVTRRRQALPIFQPPSLEAPMEIDWDIRREGRAWTEKEFRGRVDLRPEKLEVWEGKLLFSDEERLALLGLLLENVGADAAVKLGNPNVWIRAALDRPRPFLSDPFNRGMLLLTLLSPLVIVGVVLLPRHVPASTPVVLSALISAVVAFGVSVFVEAFLRE